MTGCVWRAGSKDTQEEMRLKAGWALVMEGLGVQARASLGEVWGQAGTIALTQVRKVGRHGDTLEGERW